MAAVTTPLHEPRAGRPGSEEYDTVVIGGGQAGLVMGRELVAQDRRFLIVDASGRVGDAWRRRWDSLRLNTPAKYALPDLPLGDDPYAFVTKDEFADYLARYAEVLGLPVATGTRITRLESAGERYRLTTADGRTFSTASVVIATGPFQEPRIPDFAADLSDAIRSLHSHDYRNPAQLAAGRTLVVGFGNSATEIALELSRTHETWISGEPSGELPFRHGRTAARFAFPVVRFALVHVVNGRTPLGRRLLAAHRGRAEPLIRVRRRELSAAGVRTVPRTTGVREGRPVVGETAVEVANVVWCTGYREAYDWVDLPGFEEGDRPPHRRGAVTTAPGVYLVGSHLLFSAGSGTLGGLARDARWIARHLPPGRAPEAAPVGTPGRAAMA